MIENEVPKAIGRESTEILGAGVPPAAWLSPLNAEQVEHANRKKDNVGHPSGKLGGEICAVRESFAHLIQHHVQRAD